MADFKERFDLFKFCREGVLFCYMPGEREFVRA